MKTQQFENLPLGPGISSLAGDKECIFSAWEAAKYKNFQRGSVRLLRNWISFMKDILTH